jgi:hypothetical protein
MKEAEHERDVTKAVGHATVGRGALRPPDTDPQVGSQVHTYHYKFTQLSLRACPRLLEPSDVIR